jgi:hypothetical protein
MRNFNISNTKNKKIILKIFKILVNFRFYQDLNPKIFGLKFKPYLEKKRNFKSNCLCINKFGQMMKEKINFFFPYTIRFLGKGKAHKFKEPTFLHTKEICFKNIYFEESADQIKVFLDTNLIKNSINKNTSIGCSWGSLKSSRPTNLMFWKNYFSSCYNFMTKFKISCKIKINQKKINRDEKKSISENLDFEFFQFSNDFKDKKINSSVDLSFFTTKLQNIRGSGYFNKKILFWRNKKKNIYIVLKKKKLSVDMFSKYFIKAL